MKMISETIGSKLFIGGEWVEPKSTATIEVISPLTEKPIASVARASREDVDRAVSAARQAFDTGPWPRFALEERIAAILRLRAEIEKRTEAFAEVITGEMGSPISYSRIGQARTPLSMLQEQCEIAARFPWTEWRSSPTGSACVVRSAKGVVVSIVPWNMPLVAIVQKIGPALLSGCTVIVKPAPETPLSAMLLAECIREAQLPPGIFNLVPADREESEYLALHPDVDKVSFTGSTVAGRKLASACGERLRPITLELGGKSAAIFLDDADIAASVEALRVGSLRNSGQVCSLKTRILVSKKRESQVIEALAGLIDSMPIGDPFDANTQIGPMVSKRQMERVSNYIEQGLKEGRAIRGGLGRPAELNHGWFVRPTLLASVHPNAVIAQEEVFGPVLALSTFETEDEAIAIANNSAFGLSGAVFSSNLEKAIAVAGRVKTGVVEINGRGIGHHSPFGGVKDSGLGREGGPEGFDPYVDIKSIGLPKEYVETRLL
ncbi:aldehyde dehydrogenase [Ensifer sp. ENS07]|uniref:aldehyde dehydrogenase n=1 Tax=Ensifer sp. ENS07 TaxID=2769274 RepID=UPI001AEF1F27|nr:aldehyde dehydrogenase [Ensifer sp. ENS07]